MRGFVDGVSSFFAEGAEEVCGDGVTGADGGGVLVLVVDTVASTDVVLRGMWFWRCGRIGGGGSGSLGWWWSKRLCRRI